jgi:hypothetical protein
MTRGEAFQIYKQVRKDGKLLGRLKDRYNNTPRKSAKRTCYTDLIMQYGHPNSWEDV